MGLNRLKGSIASALFPRHLLHHQEQNDGTVPSVMLGGSTAAQEILRCLFLSLLPSPE